MYIYMCIYACVYMSPVCLCDLHALKGRIRLTMHMRQHHRTGHDNYVKVDLPVQCVN